MHDDEAGLQRARAGIGTTGSPAASVGRQGPGTARTEGCIADHCSLPHGAVGFTLPGLAIEFREDKILFVPTDGGPHYTLHLGPASGVLDVHRTTRSPGGKVEYETIARMSRGSLIATLEKEGPQLAQAFLSMWRPLRIGWLGHRHFVIATGLLPTKDDELTQVTRRGPRRRLVLDEAQWAAGLRLLESIDDLLELQDGAFTICRERRGRLAIHGWGIKTTDQIGQTRLTWLKVRGLERSLDELGRRLMQLLVLNGAESFDMASQAWRKDSG